MKYSKNLGVLVYGFVFGIMISVAQFIDALNKQLHSKRIDCMYNRGDYSFALEGKYTRLVRKRVRWFLRLWAKFTLPMGMLLNGIQKVFSWLVPTTLFRWLGSHAYSGYKSLKHNRPQWSVQYALPLLITLGIVMCWGVSGLITSYVFVLSSIWSGRVLSFLGDLLVLPWKKNASIQFCRDTCGMSKKHFSWKDYGSTYWPGFKSMLFCLARDITGLTILRQWSTFIAWASSYFLVWLGIYMVGKKLANNMGNNLLQYEKKLAATPKHTRGISHNVGWLCRYHLFKATAAQPYFDEYCHQHARLHRRKHGCVR